MALIGVTRAAEICKCSKSYIYKTIERKQLTPIVAAPLVLDEEAVRAFALREKSRGGRPKKVSPSPQNTC